MEAFFEHLFLRVPLYSYADKNSDYIERVKNEKFKLAIFLASRSFFEELARKNFNYELLNEKQKHSIGKYLNRAMFRSTPFGLFSAFSLVPWQHNEDAAQIILEEPGLDVKLDFSTLQNLWERCLKKKDGNGVKFITNSSFQVTRLDCRFLKKTFQCDQAIFSLAAMDKNHVLKAVSRYCSEQKTLDQIVGFITENFAVCKQEATEFVYLIIEEQVIMPNTLPNVTGIDYHERFFQLLHEIGESDLPGEFRTGFKHLLSAASIENLLSVSEKLGDCLAGQEAGSNLFYSISKREIYSGSLPKNYQQVISEGVNFLSRFCKQSTSADLEKFKDAFLKKFEQKEVALLEALDSQLGLGYSDFDELKVSYGFSSSYQGSSAINPSPGPNDPVIESLIEEWQNKEHFEGILEIELNEEHFDRLAKRQIDHASPPSISVVFRTLGEKILIESAGGASALSLIGRFSHFSDSYEYAKQIAEVEQAYNEDVVFAEVAYSCHLHTSNINRRPHFYQYEIPVLTGSILPADRQILLSDLSISVINNIVILRSKRLKQRVIPRISSAFNYTKSALPLFRFFCDIQNQELKTNLAFNLSDFLPGLQFYPRVSYKHCVLQLAEWHLTKLQLAMLQSGPKAEIVAQFKQLADHLQLPRFFAYTILDNFLVIDSKNDEDVFLFLSEIQNKEKVVIKEFPFLQSPSNVVNKLDRPLLPQFIASMYRKKATYEGLKPAAVSSRLAEVKRKTKDWIYLKIYCHPLSADKIITGHLFPVMKKLASQNQFDGQWFWIRYQDPDYHIRLRVNVSDPFRNIVLNSVRPCLEKLCRKGLVQYFQNDIYEREIERYSYALIEKVESVFAASSLIVAGWLRSKKDINYEDESILIQAVISTYTILYFFEMKEKESADFCQSQFEFFFSEFERSRVLKADLEKLYHRIKEQLSQDLKNNLGSKKYSLLKNAVMELVREYQAKQLQSPSLHQLTRDIIHMHLNRFFVVNQRYFEMGTYFLLYRALYTKLYKRGVQR